jgi:integrase
MRKIKVRNYNNPQRPHLRFVVGFRQSGKRSQKFFEAREEAKDFADLKNEERKINGIEAAEFPTWLRVMAGECTEELHSYGKTIRDATSHYLAHLKASEKSCKADELVRQLLRAKKADGVGERHLADLKSRLDYFVAKFDGKLVAEITSADIDDWLRSLEVGAQTRNHYRANVLQLFRFALRHGYAPTNPVEGAAKAKVISGRPGILTVDQASALLVNAAPELVPFLSIGLFAGLRRAELERLDWSEIDFESNLVEIKAEKAKTAQHRFVTLQPNLGEWLLPYRKFKGSVTPPENFGELFADARNAAGIVEWPNNALRHSFASYHLAHFKNAAATAIECGHHDSRITYRHYRELVKPREAARYWKLRPVKSSRKIVQMPSS